VADPANHQQQHHLESIGRLRAAVLGANDGIVSTASLLIGVAAAAATPGELLVAGVAALVAGAMSMAAGEYVSVRSQADAEQAEIEIERRHLARAPEYEHRELARIYEKRGLDPALASEVAEQLMAHDALEAHKRDELGITDTLRARPLQAALASGAAFSVGAALPLLLAVLFPEEGTIPAVAGISLVSLAALGFVSAKVGGAPVARGVGRVLFWGALAMGVTAAVGAAFGAVL
jgi:VIT1/CCC1 family predicted Fe2+/Mn2+ transporter